MRKFSWQGLAGGLALCLLSATVLATDAGQVIYLGFEVAGDTRFGPYVALLQQALRRTEKQYGSVAVRPTAYSMNESRYLAELKRGTIDVAWSSATEERERQFIAVRIPLDKGLLGYRVSFVMRGRQAQIDQVRTLADLRRLTLGQGLGWGDVLLYRANGIPVREASYPSLFAIVALGRVDLYPRGIGEVFSEYDKFAPTIPGLAIEKNLVFYYPWPYYFFFNRSNPGLAHRVEQGLREMIRDGSYDAMFHRVYDPSIKLANLAGRRMIRLNNPFLPKDTPLDDARLWYVPH